jgi:hypothetical protein
MADREEETVSGIVRRIVWLVLGFYMAISVALWAIHLAWPGAIGGVSDYTLGMSLMLAATFGALYAGALLLVRWTRPKSTQE